MHNWVATFKTVRRRITALQSWVVYYSTKPVLCNGGRICGLILALLMFLVARHAIRFQAPKPACMHRERETANLYPNGDQLVLITDNPFSMPNLPKARKDELLRAIEMNIQSPHVSKLHVLNKDPHDILISHNKLLVHDLGWRSTFLDAIRYANSILPAGTMFVITNSDIVFAHDSLRVIARIKDPAVVVALSRHDVDEDGHAALLQEDPPLSQDAWFMRAPFPEHSGFDFPLGALGSDNKLAYLFMQLNYTVVNWCNDVIIWHFHASQIRRNKPRLPKPYARVPETRVNMSMLASSWLASSPDCRGVHTVTLDLPRLVSEPQFASDVRILKHTAEWSDAAFYRMANLAKRNARQFPRRIAEESIYFLDAPWALMDGDSSRYIESLYRSNPSIRNGIEFALVSEASLSLVCKAGGDIWSDILFGVLDDLGAFIKAIKCSEIMQK
jgi:hypothetical protein